MATDAELADRLEAHELVVFDACPFELPSADERAFLCDQDVARGGHKNISFDPATNRLAGLRAKSLDVVPRVRDILASFSANATRWLASHLPEYAATWEVERGSFRPEEEAIRPIRFTARNDLLHVDTFPTRPAFGRRLLRMFVNMNPTEPRVWVTSETFPELLHRYSSELRIPWRTVEEWSRPTSAWLRLWNATAVERSHYDTLMLRLHHAMKADEAFQDRVRRRVWSLPPGSMWLLFADGLSHAVLRGQFALEHSYFVPVGSLRRPEASPLYLLHGAGERRSRAG